jgi:tetratricopeptide (TPR) repeat protein
LGRSHLVVSLCQLGRFSEAAEYQADAIRIAEPAQHAYTLGLAHSGATELHMLRGDWEKAHVANVQAIAAWRRVDVIEQSLAVCYSARILAHLGETSTALSRLGEGEQLVERFAARKIVAHAPHCLYILARASLLLGRLDEARKLANRAVESSVAHLGYMAHALYVLGDIESHPDRFDAETAEAKYREALALAEPRGMRPLVAHCHLGLGKLYRRTGNREQAQEHLTTATTMYREMGMRFYLEQAESEATELT